MSSWSTLPELEVDGRSFEVSTIPTAGVSLDNGAEWWGTAVRYREAGARRWSMFTLVDVHPFDHEAIEAGTSAAIAKGVGLR